MDSIPDTTMTHAETAWLVTGVPVFLALVTILLLGVFGQRMVLPLLSTLIARRSQERQQGIDPALLFFPPIVTPGQLLATGMITASLILLIVSRVAPLFLTVLLTAPATMGVIWLALAFLERRYITRLDAALPAIVGRLATYCASSSSFQLSFDRVVQDMPAGPLANEWQTIRDRFGVPLHDGTLAMPVQVVEAMALQTPSERHRTLLDHLTVALEQPHDILTTRIQTAAQALLAAERRRSEATTELSQMKYSGWAVGGAALFMAVYMYLVQQDRFHMAYGGPLGLIVGPVILLAILSPFIGGQLLSQADDADY